MCYVACVFCPGSGSSSFQRSRSSGYVLGSSTANNSEDDISDSEQEKTINTRRTYSRGSDSTAVGGGYGYVMLLEQCKVMLSRKIVLRCVAKRPRTRRKPLTYGLRLRNGTMVIEVTIHHFAIRLSQISQLGRLP